MHTCNSEASLLTQDKAKLAIAEFNQALALAPRNPDAHRAMAVELIELGRLDEAELILRRGLRDVDVAKTALLQPHQQRFGPVRGA